MDDQSVTRRASFTKDTSDASRVPAASASAGSLRELLASYDEVVEGALAEGWDAGTGTARVQLLSQASRAIAVHDAVLRHALCPLLEELPGGADVAARLCAGTEERAEQLRHFQKLTKGVAAHNVYPVSGAEVDGILESLSQSMQRHVVDETREVGDLLEAASVSVDPGVVAARMALEASRAPERVRAHSDRRPRGGSTGLERFVDRLYEWSNSHHGWTPRRPASSPATLHGAALKRQAMSGQPTVRDVLAGYDDTVGQLVAAYEAAGTWAESVAVASQMAAAVTVHDSVLGGVLCPLLDSLPETKNAAARLHQGCAERGDLLQRWTVLEELARGHPGGPEDDAREEMRDVAAALIASFRDHEREETTEVTALLEHLGDSVFRTGSSLLEDIAWPWHSEGPALLALRMALWAESSPTRQHPLLARHPRNRVLRRFYRMADSVRHRSGDSTFERWIAPRAAGHPYEPVVSGRGSERARTDPARTDPARTDSVVDRPRSPQ